MQLVKNAAFILVLALAASASADDWQVSRTAYDQPDLQGVWANNTLTPIERPDMFEGREFLTEEEMQFLRRRVREITDGDGDALFGDGAFSAAISGEVSSYDPTTGNYDQSWLVERNVHNRTSQIIEPANGKYPARTEAAIARANTSRRGRPPASWLDLTVDDRCISYGAPYLNAGYNSYWQIVQSANHVVILQEMMHDARIIPLTDMPHAPETIRLWHGDSRGYWDGDTLVVETRNYSNKSSYSHNRARLNVERFTRISETELLYQITSDQPDTYSVPFTREIVFDYSEQPIYEYACHEGNYALPNILRGARVQEQNAVQ